ncbi:MAG: hypothetical protein Q9178_002494 [Gyalolechia marmorata]
MEAPTMPQLTPEQVQIVLAYLPSVEQIYLAAGYLADRPKELQYQINNIDDNRGPEIIGSTIVIAILAISAVVLRLVCRRHMKVAISYDDYLIIVGLLTSLGQCFLQIYCVTETGYGRHLMAVGVPATQRWAKLQYAFTFLWTISMALIKVSILLFYRRLFPRENTTATWRLCHLLLMILSVALGVIGVLGFALQCTPVAYNWDLTIPGGRCMNREAFTKFTNMGNIVTDILILVMPISIVWSLHLPKNKKIGVCMLFLLGGFVCIAGILRFYYLKNYAQGRDPLYEMTNIGIWSAVEPCIGVVCACLPIMGPLLRTHIFTFTTSVFRSRKWSKGTSSGFSGQSGSGKTGSRGERKTFGRIGGEKKGSTFKGSVGDEEMGIPLKEPTAVQVNEVRHSP